MLDLVTLCNMVHAVQAVQAVRYRANNTTPYGCRTKVFHSWQGQGSGFRFRVFHSWQGSPAPLSSGGAFRIQDLRSRTQDLGPRI